MSVSLPEKINREKSEEIYRRASVVIPGGVNSPVRSFKHVGMAPMIVKEGKGDIIVDVDGNQYVDYCCSWGPLILGHSHPLIVKAAREQLEKGFSFGIATDVEEQFATKIVSLIPSIEKIRFVNSGTEATMTALRIARGATGREKIVKFAGQYHGHSDALLVQAGSGVYHLNGTASSKGVTKGAAADTIVIPFNDRVPLRTLFQAMGHEIAAVIVEPISGNMGVVPPQEGFLEALRLETAQSGALLIFDEVITGFRVGLTGAQGLYGIDPDLTCFGKVIGAGFPVAAVGGKARFMDALAPIGEVYQAGTLSGNPIAMRVGLETLSLLEQPDFYERLEAKTRRLTDPITEWIESNNFNGCLQRVGSMFTLFFGTTSVKSHLDLAQLDNQTFAQLFRFLFERGVYIPPAHQEAWFVSSAHTDDHLDQTRELILQFCRQSPDCRL